MTKDELPETRIAILENSQQNIMEKIEEIIKRFDTFEEKLDKALEKKANVWVEDAMKYVIYTCAGIVISALMYLIIKK